MASSLHLQPLPEFNPDIEIGASLAKRWESWLRDFTMFVTASGITDDTRMRALLLYTAGSRVREIFHTLSDTGTDFETAKTKLTEYFEPQKNRRYEIFKFREMKQEEGESLDSFHRRLRTAAPNCEFHDADFEVEQQIMVGGRSSGIRKKALRDPTYTLKDMLTDGRGKESSTFQSKKIESNLVKEECIEKLTMEKKPPTKVRKCYYCGGPYPHNNKKCPAEGKQCEVCLRYNHFSSCCKMRKSNPRKFWENQKAAQNSQVKQIQTTEASQRISKESASSSEEDLFMLKLASESEKVKPKTNVTIKGKKIKMIVDTGASINVIDEETFSKFQGVNLQKTNVKAYTYGGKHPVTFLGKFTTVIETRKSIAVADIYVIKEKNSGCLLSCTTAQELRLVTFHLDAVKEKKEEKKSKGIIDRDNELESILKRHKNVFKGLGKLKGNKVTLNIDPAVKPVSLKHRRVPFHIRKKVNNALKKLIEDDIIEKIPDSQPTPWVSPIVAVPQKDNTIRLCVDMRQPNLAIKRTRFPIPTTSEVDVMLNEACFFSKLDIRQAFHQVELEETSRHITTFMTHKGLFRYKRLNFGTNVASELFQNLLERQLCDIPGIKNIHDDIIVFGKTRCDHDVALNDCLQRLSDVGLTLNRSKCEFLQPELSFFGHIYSKDGIKPDTNRINDILALERPSNVKEVRSFLGMLNYCSKFIEDFSTLTAPLRELTTKQAKFTWNESHQSAFDLLKNKLTSAPVMSYFDVNKETELCVDASPFGLSAILMQKDANSENPKIIAYGSRSLSRVEQKYSQTEREALAIVWGVEHFNQYIYGSLFTIITDHKPLEIIYGNASSKPSARIERWVLRLQPYNFNIRYRNGKENPADYMSRHPSENTTGNQEGYTELYINFITKYAIPNAMTRDEIIKETNKDNMSNLLKKAFSANNWEDQRLQKFQKMKKEFSLTNDGVILRGTQIFLPHKLRDRAVAIAHESHQGLEKTKLLREKLWFPKMDSMVEDVVRTCIPCLATGKDVPPEPIKMTKMPAEPWEKLHLDFKGPLPGGKYLLVVIDRYSRYPEVEIVSSTNANTVIRKLNKIFASHGIPEVLVTDNGPPFKSNDFKGYMKQIGASHQLSTPYWPQGNAEAERFMRTLGKILTIANLTNEDLQNALSKFLFQYRITPHSTTKVPPAELLYNRNLKGKIPSERNTRVDKHDIARENEEKSRKYNKNYADDRRKARKNEIKVGDSVLLKQKVKNKMMTKFNAEPCVIVNITGSEVTVQTKEGKYVCRNKSFFKKIPISSSVQDSDDEDEDERPRIRVEEAPEVVPTNTDGESEESNDDTRSSSRSRRPPERYGFPVPSEIVDETS